MMTQILPEDPIRILVREASPEGSKGYNSPCVSVAVKSSRLAVRTSVSYGVTVLLVVWLQDDRLRLLSPNFAVRVAAFSEEKWPTCYLSMHCC